LIVDDESSIVARYVSTIVELISTSEMNISAAIEILRLSNFNVPAGGFEFCVFVLNL
jgi:hypothetical protein